MKNLISNTIILLFVILLSACSKKSEYRDAIPHDASLLVSVSMDKIVQKSGINEGNGKILVERLSNAFKSGLDAKSHKYVDELLKNPSSSGISLKDDIYIFSLSSSRIFGILAKLDDVDKFKSVVKMLNKEGISSEIHSGDRCEWAKVGDVLCAFNNGTLMILSNGTDDVGGLKETLMSYMRQDSEKSFSNKPYFNKLTDAKGEISMVLNFSLLPRDLVNQLKMGMPADMKLEDLKYFMNIDFNVGKISCQLESLIEDKSIINTLEEVERSMMYIKSDLLPYYPSTSVMWCGASLKGGEFYNILRKNPAIERLLNDPMLPIDINDIFSAIDGDVAIGYSSPSLDDILLYGKVKSDRFLSSFDALIPLVALTGGQMTLKKSGASAYHFSMMGANLWFGVKNGLLYVTNNATLASMACEKYPNSLLNTKAISSINNSRFVAFINAQEIVDQMTLMSNYNLRTIEPILNYCDYATANVTNWKSGNIEIILKDKDVNALQLLVSELQKL